MIESRSPVVKIVVLARKAASQNDCLNKKYVMGIVNEQQTLDSINSQ